MMTELKKKHPEPAPIQGDPLLRGPLQPIPECFFDSICEQTILKAAKDTKGSGGPSGLGTDQCRRILCSEKFLQEGLALREELAIFTRNLATIHFDPKLIETYIACRLIPLDKNPGIRPIGVGEVWRRIVIHQ